MGIQKRSFLVTGTAGTESSGSIVPHSNVQEINEDSDEKQNYVQKTMDFAANIEKVKEVIAYTISIQIVLYDVLNCKMNNLIFSFLTIISMDGIGDRFQVKQLRKFYRTNQTEVL